MSGNPKQGGRDMREPSEAQRQSRLKIATQLARTARDGICQQGLASVLSPEQLKRIKAWCKMHGVDRRSAIAEIIEAGMEAKGIGLKRKRRA
jgi:hypothetical protein